MGRNIANRVINKLLEGQTYTYPTADVTESGTISASAAYIQPNWTIVVDITLVNNATTVTLATPFAFTIADVLILMTSGGNGGCSLIVGNGASAITDTIDLGTGDADLQRAGTIDDAYYAFAKDDDDLRLTFAATEGSTVSTFSCRVIIYITPN